MGIYRLSDRLVRLETAGPGATEDTIAHRLHPSATCRAAKIAILLAYNRAAIGFWRSERRFSDASTQLQGRAGLLRAAE